MLFDQPFPCISFLTGCLSSERQPKSTIHLHSHIIARFALHSLRKQLRLLHTERAIEQIQRLQRRRRCGSLRRNLAAVGAVEGAEGVVGLHARPAALFVQTAKRYTAAITVHTGARQANAKSMVQVLTLAAGQGAELTIRAEGEDADQALVALRDLIATGFHEGAA